MTKGPIHVATPDECEKAAYVVCNRIGTPTIFTDNVIGTCAHCGHGIYFRPYVPRKPPKICLECCLDLCTGGHA